MRNRNKHYREKRGEDKEGESGHKEITGERNMERKQ